MGGGTWFYRVSREFLVYVALLLTGGEPTRQTLEWTREGVLRGISHIRFLRYFFRADSRQDLANARPCTQVMMFLIQLVFTFQITRLTLRMDFIFFMMIRGAFPNYPLNVNVSIRFRCTMTCKIFSFLDDEAKAAIRSRIRTIIQRIIFLEGVFLEITRSNQDRGRIAQLMGAICIARKHDSNRAQTSFTRLNMYMVGIFQLNMRYEDIRITIIRTIFFAANTARFSFRDRTSFKRTLRMFETSFGILLREFFERIGRIEERRQLANDDRIFFAHIRRAISPQRRFFHTIIDVRSRQGAMIFDRLIGIVHAESHARSDDTLQGIEFRTFADSGEDAAIKRLGSGQHFGFDYNFRCNISKIDASTICY